MKNIDFEGPLISIWLLLYGSTSLLCNYYAPLNPFVKPVFHLANVFYLLVWLVLMHRGRVRVFAPLSSQQWKRHLFFIPYLFPIICQITCFGIQRQSVISVCCILLAVIQEEMFFRGIMLHYVRFSLRCPNWARCRFRMICRSLSISSSFCRLCSLSVSMVLCSMVSCC